MKIKKEEMRNFKAKKPLKKHLFYLVIIKPTLAGYANDVPK